MDKEIRNTGENFQETEFLKLKKPADDRIVLIEDLNENSDKIDKFCKDTENNKQNKEDITLPTTAKNIIGAIREIFVELWKIGSTTQFGRFKVGKNLSVDANGFLNGNPSYTHPSGNGNTHLPAGGAAGQFIKWLSSGVGQWAAITWGDITGKPSTFTPSSHTHSKSQITDFAHTHSKSQITDFAHTHDERYFTEAEILEKFKNFCPFPINSIFLSLDNSNPAMLFLGTTWQKQEGRFLLGSNSAYTLGSTGGSSTTTLSKENLPNVKLQIDSFSLGKGTQEITGDFYTSNYIGYAGSGAFYSKQSGLGGHGGNSSSGNKIGFQASKSWTGMSTSAAPYTANMGDSTPFNNMPPYLVVNIWKRLS